MIAFPFNTGPRITHFDDCSPPSSLSPSPSSLMMCQCVFIVLGRRRSRHRRDSRSRIARAKNSERSAQLDALECQGCVEFAHALVFNLGEGITRVPKRKKTKKKRKHWKEFSDKTQDVHAASQQKMAFLFHLLPLDFFLLLFSLLFFCHLFVLSSPHLYHRVIVVRPGPPVRHPDPRRPTPAPEIKF